MWFLGTIAGGAMVAYLLRDSPGISFSILGFVVISTILMLVAPEAAWWFIVAIIGLLVMGILAKLWPAVIGFFLGLLFVFLVITTLPAFLASIL